MPVEYVSATFMPGPHKPVVYTHGFSIKSVVSIHLLAAVIPNARYIIHDGNNKIEIKNIHGTCLVSLPVGNAALTPAKLAEVTQTATFGETADDTFQCNILAPSNKIEMRSTLGPFHVRFPSDSTLYRNLGMNGVGGVKTSSVPDGEDAHVVLCPPPLRATATGCTTFGSRRRPPSRSVRSTTSSCAGTTPLPFIRRKKTGASARPTTAPAFGAQTGLRHIGRLRATDGFERVTSLLGSLRDLFGLSMPVIRFCLLVFASTAFSLIER